MAFEKVDTEYFENLTPDDVPCIVRIGGSLSERFVPNINCSKWDDEFWYNCNHPDIVTTQVETIDDEKIELSIGG